VHSKITNNSFISNDDVGLYIDDYVAVGSSSNLITGNTVRDDGSGVYSVDGTAFTQTWSISVHGTGANNRITQNIVDTAIWDYGADTVSDNITT